MGRSAVPATAGDGDLEEGRGREERPGSDVDRAERDVSGAVKPADAIDVRLLEDAGFDARGRASRGLLGWLEDEPHIPRKVAGAPKQQLGEP